jgi:hypothetical protein
MACTGAVDCSAFVASTDPGLGTESTAWVRASSASLESEELLLLPMELNSLICS